MLDNSVPSADDNELNGLITSFINRIPGALGAVVCTSDGLLLALSDRIARDGADQMAAVTSALTSLTAGAAQCFGSGEVNQVIVDMEGGFLFVTSISDGSSLAVLCDPMCDIGLIGYEMSMLVERIGQLLTPDLRARLQHAFEADAGGVAPLPRGPWGTLGTPVSRGGPPG
jgi:predicted regulator of Ras-like GTPase activity (Roadblock/LC7/MglB family)